MPTPITSFPIGNPVGQTIYAYAKDTSGGNELYLKNENTVCDQAGGFALLMTALLVYEYKSSVFTSETATVNATDVTQPVPTITFTSAGLQNGDIITWENLVYSIMLPGGFDAARCAARNIGDYIFSLTGTGNSGETRFIETMNSRAAALGMTNSFFSDPWGTSKFDATRRNEVTAKDAFTLAKQVFDTSALRAISISPTKSFSVTGSNPRTVNVTNFDKFANGPTLLQAGITNTDILGAAQYFWNYSGAEHQSGAHLWQSPNGTNVIFVVLNSESAISSMLDQRGLIYSAVKDFEYLTSGASTLGDSSFANVQVLVGADNSFYDESSAARTLTNNSVTLTNPVILSAGGGLLNALSDYISFADAAALRVGSGDMTAEMWFAGDGSAPGAEYLFFSKWDHVGNKREWTVDLFSNQIQIFASSDGTAVTQAVAYNLSANDTRCFTNGAPRHIAYVKNGSTWSLYINGERATNTISVGTAFGGTAPLAIGYTISSNSFLGSFDDFRYTVGTARYTAAMVTVTPRMFPRSLLAPTPDSFQTRLGPQHPLRIAEGVPMGGGFGTMGGMRRKPGFLFGYVNRQSVEPVGQSVAAAATLDIRLRPFPLKSPICGPWRDIKFLPVKKLNYDHLLAPVPPTPQIIVPPIGQAFPVKGPWNKFGLLRTKNKNYGPEAPLPAGVSPPTAPDGLSFGPSRQFVPSIPRAPFTTDDRVRPHIDKVANLLNSLLRRGYITYDDQEFSISGGGVALARAPLATDDASQGAVVGQIFINTLTGQIYVNRNNSVGSAVWQPIMTSTQLVAMASSVLLGSIAGGAGSPYSEIVIGSGLQLIGNILTATGGGGGTLSAPVSLSDLQTIAADSFVGNNTASTATPTAVSVAASRIVGRTASSRLKDMTGTEATALLDAFVAAGGSALKGIVPAPGSTAHTNRPYFLGDNGSWTKLKGEVIGFNYTATSETTSATTPSALATAQDVSITLDETSDIYVLIACTHANDTAAVVNRVAVKFGSDSAVQTIRQYLATANSNQNSCGAYVKTSAAAGTYTVSMLYSCNVGGTTQTYADRTMLIMRIN